MLWTSLNHDQPSFWFRGFVEAVLVRVTGRASTAKLKEEIASIIIIIHCCHITYRPNRPNYRPTALFFFAKCLWNPMQAQVPPLTSDRSAISSSFLYLGFVVKRGQSHPVMIKTGSTAKNTSLSVLSHQGMGRFNPIKNIQETCGTFFLMQNNANINTWPINNYQHVDPWITNIWYSPIPSPYRVTTSTAFPTPKKDGSGWRSCACCSSRGSSLPWCNGGCAKPHDVYTGTRDSPQKNEACLNIDTGKKEGSCGN